MATIQINPVAAALSHMEQARNLLLEQLSTPEGLSANVAECLDLLDGACTYAQNPEQTIPTCPDCGSIYNEAHGMGYVCICCDHPWIPKMQAHA